ncbi:hypothetical protein [Alteromonas sp. a30]|uniref:hypothetical protein n=1 Tax=Alteromonas sp. a30 TaxID=2730917 RepID=UPI00227EECA7|nr:hypothetical protein [Alteromonas sp. a30]MCY7295815.1 hypothetical protein [Alteromonas sp. a30]
MDKTTLQIFSKIYDKLESTKAFDNEIEGEIAFNQSLLDDLSILGKNELCQPHISFYKGRQRITDKTFDEVHEELFKKYTAKVTLITFKEGGYFICENWNTLLQYESVWKQPINGVFLYGSKRLLFAESQDSRFNNYLNLFKLSKLIEKASIPASGKERIIIHGEALHITNNINEQLLETDIDINTLEDFLTDELHQEAKINLFRGEVFNLLHGIGKEHRFEYLVTHFNAFSSRLLASYKNFINDYTFDKVRKEYQEKKTEYIGRSNKIFDDISTKLFSIPAGVWLAITQIKQDTSNSFQNAQNLAVVLAVISMSLIIILMISGQFKNLEAIRNEYKGLFERLSREYKEESEEINKAYNEIENRGNAVWWKLCASNIATISLSIITITLAVYAF